VLWVVVGTDAVGSFVMLLRDEDKLLGGDGVRFRLALQTEDQTEVATVADQEHRRIRAGQPDAA
jgi:hypothetical protein